MTTGAEISRRFFDEAVRPVIDDVLAGVGYLAGRLGSGSDVLGFDDATSTDHDFGCRLTVLVDDEHTQLLPELDRALTARLPDEIDGWPVRFPTSWDERATHKVDLHTVHQFATSRLGVDPRSPLGASDWLGLTGQSVLEVTAGPVFADTTDTFSALSRTLTWYPDDLWYYVLAAGWTRLGQELHFVGRTGQLGDEAGCRIITSRLCRDVVHLTFLIERTWPPYPKWVGSALRRLPGGTATAGQVTSAQAAADWTERQRRLADLIEGLAERHRQAGVELRAPVLEAFYDRGLLTTADHVAATLRQRIAAPEIRDLPLVGSIEQWCDNVDVLSRSARRPLVAAALGIT